MRKRIVLCLVLAWVSSLARAETSSACREIEYQGSDAYSLLAERLQAQRQAGGGKDLDRLAACGLDEADLLQHQCHHAYDQQNLKFLLRHCQIEAWSLARAQCERSQDRISPHYAEFCRAFGRE